jgi:pyruvate ferredoxin oxidoreductase alpha subunit
VLQQVEGSKAVAAAVAACRPQVVCAYPISPQTHIVEQISRLVKSGQLHCEYLNVDCETSALSGLIGAAAVGARTYTATSSQGLLHMSEAVFNAAGLGLSIVMTVANRALGAPINIWNDHSDSMSQRDSGWVQVHASSNQAAADLHVLAFRLAETVSLPVMVCMDGFVLTHATERVDVPDAAVVDAYLPPFAPHERLDPDDPVSIGAMVGPEAFTEVRYVAHRRHLRVPEVLPGLAAELSHVLGRAVPGLVEPYRLEGAETVVLALGSTVGTLQDVVDAARDAGHAVGLLGLTLYRPFPADAVRDALAGARRVVVVERAFQTGVGGIVTDDVRRCLPSNGHGRRADDAGHHPALHTVVAGLGGRPVTRASLAAVVDRAAVGDLPELTFLDLDTALLAREGALADVERIGAPAPDPSAPTPAEVAP